MVKIYRTTLPVGPIAEATAFYQRILNRTGTRISPTRHYFNCGGTILAICDFGVEGFGPKPGWKPFENQYVYFAVDDLEAALERFKKAGGAVRDNGIQTKPWKERLFYATDLFGNAICFVDEKTIYVAG